MRHGSRDGGIIDAIQLESPSTFRRERFDDYVEALATSIHGYVGRYYPAALQEEDPDTRGTSGAQTLLQPWCIVAVVLSRLG